MAEQRGPGAGGVNQRTLSRVLYDSGHSDILAKVLYIENEPTAPAEQAHAPHVFSCETHVRVSLFGYNPAPNYE